MHMAAALVDIPRDVFGVVAGRAHHKFALRLAKPGRQRDGAAVGDGAGEHGNSVAEPIGGERGGFVCLFGQLIGDGARKVGIVAQRGGQLF
jgi:hypothetical protein